MESILPVNMAPGLTRGLSVCEWEEVDSLGQCATFLLGPSVLEAV